MNACHKAEHENEKKSKPKTRAKHQIVEMKKGASSTSPKRIILLNSLKIFCLRKKHYKSKIYCRKIKTPLYPWTMIKVD